MKFSVAQEQHSYFYNHGAIEFEGLISGEEISRLQHGIREGLAVRLGCTGEAIDKSPPENRYFSGRDLWRCNQEVKTIMGHRRFGEIASQLVKAKMLRLGYDQYFPSAWQGGTNVQKPYLDLLAKAKNLSSYGSIQGVLCGLMICISENPQEPIPKNLHIFPSAPGNGVFFKPSMSLDFTDLVNRIGQEYYLIVYASVKSVYKLNREDNHSRDWIDLGYEFGDKLSDSLHPIIFR